jgi:type II secretory pathway pseudopilin PulG
VRTNFKTDRAEPVAGLGSAGTMRFVEAVVRRLKAGSGAAFSLIEIMVAMVLLSFIILGLLAMFHQTQKAFRSSMTQVDVLESGRSVTDLIARDLEQMIASSLPFTNAGNYRSTNFFAYVSTDFAQPLLQQMPGTVAPRTNVIQTLFFIRKENQDWIGTGYQVRPEFNYPNAGIGTLYRYSATQPKSRAIGLSQGFLNALPPRGVDATNLNRIADGVVSLRVRAYDTNGVEIVTTNTGLTHLAFPVTANRRLVTITNGFGSFDSLNSQYNYFFVSNALPASLEVEVAFLEPHLLDRYRALAGGLTALPQALQDAQIQYLASHAANVHVFRQRVSVRNVDPLAYQ